MGCADRWQTFEDCGNEANDLENMAALVEAWCLDSVMSRVAGQDGLIISPREADVLIFAARDLAKRSKRVADMIGHLPR